MQLINQQSDFVVCAEAENAAQALDAIEKQQIDLAIVDISMKGTTGIQLTEKVKSRCLNLPVLILSVQDESPYPKRAFRTGAKGYVLNQEATKQIIRAIQYVKSLLASRVFGFTVFVKVGSNVTDGNRAASSAKNGTNSAFD